MTTNKTQDRELFSKNMHNLKNISSGFLNKKNISIVFPTLIKRNQLKKKRKKFLKKEYVIDLIISLVIAKILSICWKEFCSKIFKAQSN